MGSFVSSFVFLIGVGMVINEIEIWYCDLLILFFASLGYVFLLLICEELFEEKTKQ